MTFLGDLCFKIGSGATPKGGKDSYRGGGYALIRSQNVQDWEFTKVVPEFLRTLVFARPRGDDQFADCTFSPSLDMSR